MLCAHIAVPQPTGVLPRQPHHLPRTGRQSLGRHPRVSPSGDMLHGLGELFRVKAVVPQDFRPQPVSLGGDADEDMLSPHITMAQIRSREPCPLNGRLGPVCKLVGIFHWKTPSENNTD